MRRFPSEFADLLGPKGLRILSGAASLDWGEDRFLAVPAVIAARRARECERLLETKLASALIEMDDPIPSESTALMSEDYSELLPKTVRARTALLGSRNARSYRIAADLGLVAMLRSPSFHAFASALAGRALRKGWGIQLLRYGPGDYAGPHNDHHPEEPTARDGYLDLHLSFASESVSHQWLVYERAGHFSEMVSVATRGGLTAYRLPFWHYTTPLVARPRRARDARRWVMLGTFLFQRASRSGSMPFSSE